MAKADDEDTPPFNEFVALANKLLRRLLDEFHHAELAKQQTREAPTTSCVRRNLAYFDYRVEAPVPPRDIVCPQPIEAEPPLPTTPAPTVQKSTKNYEQDRMHAALKKRWPPDGLPPEDFSKAMILQILNAQLAKESGGLPTRPFRRDTLTRVLRARRG